MYFTAEKVRTDKLDQIWTNFFGLVLTIHEFVEKINKRKDGKYVPHISRQLVVVVGGGGGCRVGWKKVISGKDSQQNPSPKNPLTLDFLNKKEFICF